MKHLTRFFIIIIGFCLPAFVRAQIQVTLTIPNLGSPYLSDYIGDESNRVLILTNTTGQEQSIFLRGKIEQLSTPGYFFRTKADFKPLFPVVLAPFETKTLFARSEDWAFMATGQLEDNVPSAEKRRIQATGILPEGEYQICIQAFDFNSETPLSPAEPAGCQFFMVTLGSPPQILQPACDDTLRQEFPLITWTPAILMQATPDIVYDLYVVELTSRALNPQEVMEQSIEYRGGNPFVVENLRQTFYQFLPGDPPFNADSRYAICVVARSQQGSAQFENNGRSEICLFYTTSPRGISGGPEPSGPAIVATQIDPGIYQLHKTSHLQGKLLYRFYGDGAGIGISQMGAQNLDIMQLQPGQTLQNQGYQGSQGSSGGLVMGNSGSMAAAVFDNSTYQQPPPPQWILPPGYSTQGGKPLKQARIRFTARYAVGNTTDIRHPEDLTLIPGMGYPIRVTGAQIPEQLTFQPATKVIASTTTDNDGNYDVTFFADETFGMITGSSVDVQWGGGEFPAGVSGYGLYKVITMEVEEKWYCHPDIIIFLQPGQSLEVPTQCVTVQSYDVRFTVKANDQDQQQAGAGGPIQDAIVKVGRAKYLYDQFPACFPKDEMHIADFGDMMIGSPLKNVMTGDTGMTNADGQIIFRRLIKHDGWEGCSELFEGWPTDVYYVEAGSHPTQGYLNYHIERKKQFAPCEARLSSFCHANDCAPRSAGYKPPLVEYEIILIPLFPKIVAYSQGDFGPATTFLPDVTMIMLVYHEDGDFRLKPYKTDHSGHFYKQFTTADKPELMRTVSTGQITSRYVMDYFKSGYKRVQCNGCGDLNNKQVLQMGQRWNIDMLLEPKSQVKAIVEDEHGQPIYGDVKIGDGPYLPFGPKPTIAQDPGGIDPGLPYGEILQQGGLEQLQMQQQGQGQGQLQIQQQQGLQGGLMQMQGNPGQVVQQEGGMQVEYEVGNLTLGMWEMVSWFQYPGQSGQNVPVIIRPDATNYFADTFYIDIPSNYDGPYFDMGTLVIKEKLHRPRVVVYQNMVQINPQTLEAQNVQVQLEGAEVILSNLPVKVTGADGVASWVFGSPANEFRLRINKQGYIPYDQYVVIPPTKEAYPIEIILEHGKVLTGTVTRADGGQPIEGARMYTEIGSNNYGPIVIESFTDANGNYTLDGLPTGVLEIQATKADPDVTYIGQTKTVNTATTTQLNFQLQEAPFNLSHIWNLPVAIESVTPSGNNWKVNGAFVDLPHNARFKPEDETQRLEFTNITVQVAGPPGPNGKPPVEPTGNSLLTNSLQFRSILNDAHIVEMSGPKAPGGLVFVYDPQYAPVSINKIRVDKAANDNGHVKTRVFSLLEYFRITYNYNGQFFLGETPDDILVSSYKGTADMTMPETYHLMGYNYFLNQAVNPNFVVHNFPAYTDRHESYVHQDSFVLAAKLIVDLPLSNPDKITVSTGDIIVLPDKVHVNQGDEPLEFDLETWHVETGVWEFDPNQGGIVTSGVIQTNLIEFYAPNIVIKPTSLKLPSAGQINLNSLTLGGVVDLNVQPNAQLWFDYQHSPSHDPAHGHWRLLLSHQQTGQAVADISSLPGWPSQTKVDILYIKNYSDGFKELDMKANQVVNHYNMIEQTVSQIYLYDNGVALYGNTDLQIPNCPNGASAAFVYSLHQGQLSLRVQGLYTTFETIGQVEFQGDQQPERIYLNWDHFEVTGDIRIYDDLSATEIPLRGKLIKKPNDIRIKIIKVDGGGELEGNVEQIIVLGGGQNGHKKILQGEQLVANGAWENLIYQAQFIGFGGGFQDGGDIMWFRVTGSLINDPTQADEVELANIETPFGDFSLTLVFSEMAIVGNLNVSNISMGAVTIIEGAINMRMGGLGFYLAAHLRAIYPVIAELNTNFIVGSYPHIAPDAQEILKQGMYIQPLPDFLLQTGIQGLYICANKPMFEVDWEIDLLVFGIGIWAEAGIDARFWLNFGSQYGAAHLGGLGYAAFELYVNVLGICDLCVGLLAELGFEATYQWEPTTSFDISACGTIGFSVDFCGTGFNETAKLEVGWSSSSNDVYYDAVLGESCSGNAEQGGGGCSHF